MKIEVKEWKTSENKKYPYIGVGKVSHSIILITAPFTGTIIYCPNKFEMGNHYQDIIEETFEKFKGSITLSNDED